MCGLQLPQGGGQMSSLHLMLSPEPKQRQIEADDVGQGNGEGPVPCMTLRELSSTCKEKNQSARPRLPNWSAEWLLIGFRLRALRCPILLCALWNQTESRVFAFGLS